MPASGLTAALPVAPDDPTGVATDGLLTAGADSTEHRAAIISRRPAEWCFYAKLPALRSGPWIFKAPYPIKLFDNTNVFLYQKKIVIKLQKAQTTRLYGSNQNSQETFIWIGCFHMRRCFSFIELCHIYIMESTKNKRVRVDAILQSITHILIYMHAKT